MRKNMLLLALVSLLAYTACGGSNNGIPDLPPAPPGDGGGDKTGGEPLNSTVKGKITWEGEVPKAKPISTSADPNCKNPSLVSEETVVSDGGLENVILFVSSDLSGRKFPASTERSQRTYWTTMGWSKPISRRICAIACGVASVPSMTAAGSPGIRRTIVNTMIDRKNRTRTSWTDRSRR